MKNNQFTKEQAKLLSKSFNEMFNKKEVNNGKNINKKSSK